jgi:hypothetical protein
MIEIVTKVVVKLFATTKINYFLALCYMSISSPASTSDSSVWASLKQAIAASPGFQHWATQLSSLEQANLSLDDRVQRYLRETLETLAY